MYEIQSIMNKNSFITNETCPIKCKKICICCKYRFFFKYIMIFFLFLEVKFASFLSDLLSCHIKFPTVLNLDIKNKGNNLYVIIMIIVYYIILIFWDHINNKTHFFYKNYIDSWMTIKMKYREPLSCRKQKWLVFATSIKMCFKKCSWWNGGKMIMCDHISTLREIFCARWAKNKKVI